MNGSFYGCRLRNVTVDLSNPFQKTPNLLIIAEGIPSYRFFYKRLAITT